MNIPTTPALPTLDRLGVSLAPDLDVLKVASEWFHALSTKLEAGDVEGTLSLFVDDAFWRDILSLTWNFRTFYGAPAIRKFLQDRLGPARLKSLKLERAELLQPYPDIAWIQGLFTFEIGELGAGDGVFRIVPTAIGEWKGHVIYTNLQSLKNHPEKIGHYRDHMPSRGQWVEKRRKALEFEDVEPYVIIVGGGQSGLELAARLQFLDVPTLVVEKSDRIGDQWRGRYETLCLHDPVWYNHMAYLPFPDSWPVYIPAQKLADWLEFYAHSMEIDVWLSSLAVSVRQDPVTKEWTVIVRRGGDTDKERVFHPAHVVLALGTGGGVVNMPEVPGMETFEGKILHSTQHKTARDNIGKKVVIIGAATSGHDVAADHVDHGVDVTMYQRSPTYIMSVQEGHKRFLRPFVEGSQTDIADRIHTSFPLRFLSVLHKRETLAVAEADKEIIDGLTKKGFKLTWGDDGSGFLLLAYTRGGGYYLDAGASQMIIDGRIKFKSDSEIDHFTKNGLKFQDGSELGADVVIFANGFGSARDAMSKICGPEIGKKIKKIWGLDEEGESMGAWRDCGVDTLWCMMGNLAMARYHSRHVALQIKAMKEGLFGGRYSA